MTLLPWPSWRAGAETSFSCSQTRTNERALSVDHGGEVMQRVQSSELRVQEVMCGRSVEREEEERLVRCKGAPS